MRCVIEGARMEREGARGNQPSVVSRHDIPISDAPEDMDLEVRFFDAHALLSSVVPRSDVTLAWTHAKPDQEVSLRSHATRGLLIILDGNGELTGAMQRTVEQGDVVTVPAGHQYGFRDIGAQGLHALHVAFGDEANAKAEARGPLEQLLARNQARAQSLINNPFFMLLREGKLESSRKRAMMRECLRVFSDAFQSFLFVRQATCRDEDYSRVFHEHLREELGHNTLLRVAGDRGAAQDPILQATSTWFCHQMLVQDNAGKAVLNIVLETAGYYFHTLAKPVFEGDDGEEYFNVHAEEDEKHMQVGVKLLEGMRPDAYKRLTRVLDDGWDMLDAMNRRVVRLVELDATGT
jgi:mannose-6-phosphate isomerase-like protein (cupin superfamily)